MQIEIGQSEFSKALDKVSGAIESKTTIPILSNILVQAKGEGLTLTATDLEVAIRVTVPAKVKREGTLCLPGKKLREIVHRLAAVPVKIKAGENNWAHLEAGTAKYKLVGMLSEHFPQWPSEPKGNSAILDGAALKRAVELTAFAVSQENSRYTLDGIFFDAGEIVATDGHRLSLYRVNSGFKEVKKALIPRRGLSLIAGMVDEGNVTLIVGESHYIFSAEHWTLVVRKLTGQFPNYQAIIPKRENATVRATFNAALLKERIDRVSMATPSATGCMRFDFVEGAVNLLASSPEHGEASESLSITCKDKLSIGFNHRYISEFLQRIEGDVEFFGRDEQSGALFEHGDLTYVAMPMRF